MKKIIIYTGKSCAPCKMAKGYMDYHNIPYTEIDIETGEIPDDIRNVPTIICKDDPDIKLVGFSQGIGNKIKRWYND